jgi:hypothetical protein
MSSTFPAFKYHAGSRNEPLLLQTLTQHNLNRECRATNRYHAERPEVLPTQAIMVS